MKDAGLSWSWGLGVPIPPFTASGVIHPWWDWQQQQPGGAAIAANFSPHRATMLEVVNTLGGSDRHRRKLIDGLLRYRNHLRTFGLNPFTEQWIDGSFVERRQTPPNDIDVVTLLYPPFPQFSANLASALTNWQANKPSFHCDTYAVQVSGTPSSAALLAYWLGLFSHRRSTSEWKGMLVIPLDDSSGQDAQAALRITQLGGI